MLCETCVDFDRYPNANIAEYSLILSTENSVEMSGYFYKAGIHALQVWQPVRNRVSGRCRYDGASTAKSNDSDRVILLCKTIDHNKRPGRPEL